MKKAFSTRWNSSKSVAKQRKFRIKAPLHIKQRFLSVHLSKDLRKKYGVRAVRVRTGDKVKVLRGQYKGRENKVERVSLKDSKVFVSGIERSKKDGSKSHIPINPSNIMITDLNLDDKKRKAKLENVKKSSQADKVKSEVKLAKTAKPDVKAEADVAEPGSKTGEAV